VTIADGLTVSGGTVSGAGITSLFASPPAIGGTAAAAGTFTALTAASGTVSNAVINTAALDTSLDLNFLSGVLDSRISFTRASTATYFDATGTMQTAAAGVARFDHAPTLVASASAPYVYTPLGLLIEEGRTNVLLNSSNTATGWGGTGSPTITAASSGAPDGTATLNHWIRTTTGACYTAQQVTKAASSLAYAASIYAAAGANGRYLAFSIQGQYPNNTSVVFDLLLGTVGTVTNGGSGFTGTATITPVGKLYRCTLASPTSDTATAILFYYSFNSNGINQIAGTDSASNSDGYVWGAQLEQAAFVTSYIPTTSAAVTRAADVATMPVGSWFTQGLGALCVDAQLSVASSVNGSEMLASLDDGSLNNRVALYRPATSAAINAVVTLASSAVYAQAAGTSTPGTAFRAAIAFTGGTQAAALAGTLGTGGTAATMPSALTTLRFGVDSAGAEVADGYLRRVRYWPRALSTTELQTVTASATPALLNLAIDQCPIGATNPSSGAFTTITLSQAEIDASAYTTAPVTSGTVTIPGTAARCVINPAGTLAALTVVSPAALSLGANSVQSLDILFTQAITSLTWTAGSGTTFGGAAMPSTVALGTCVRLLWVQSLSKWLHTTVV
jgi:hypothetical protein